MRGFLFAAALLAALCPPVLAQEEGAADAAPPLPGAAAEAKPLKPAERRADQLDSLFARLRGAGEGSPVIEQQIWELWSASDSPTAEVLLQQATRAIGDGAPAEALLILDSLVGAYPDFPEAWNKRATLYFMMKREDQALKDIEKTLDLEPRHFAALAGKGMILQRQKKYSAARAAFEEALAINPNLEQVKAAIKDLDRLEQGI